MMRVILNILRRNWFVIPGAAFLVSLNPFYAHPELSAPLWFSDLMGVVFVVGPFLISVEAYAGSNTVLRTLPVSTRTMGGGYWLLGVVLFPMLYLVCSPTLAVLTHREPLEALPRVMIALIGMGYASIMTLVQVPFTRRESGTKPQGGIQDRAGYVFIVGGFILHQLLLSGYRDGNAWFYVVLAASPVFILLSYLHVTNAMHCLSINTNGLRSRSWRPQPPADSARIHLWQKAAGAGLAYALMFALLLRYTNRSQYAAEIFESILPGTCVLMAWCAGTVGRVWAPSIRALRMLPMSSLRLTCTLVSTQTIALLAATVTLCLLLPILNSPHLALAACIGLAIGFAASLCTSALLLRFNAWALMAMMPASLSLLGFTLTPMPYHALIAVLVSVWAVHETKRLLERSGQVYRQKQPGQNLSQR